MSSVDPAATILQAAVTATATSTSTGTFNAASSIFNLFITFIGAIITMADALAEILYILFSLAGIQLPLVVFRVITIVIGAIGFWRFIGGMTWTVKMLIAIVLISMVVSIFGGSAFGGGIAGNWFQHLFPSTGTTNLP